jgi:hypothetical protein
MSKSAIKKEVEAAAIETIKCPSCGAEPGSSCCAIVRGLEVGQLHRFANRREPHQRRLSAFISSDKCRFSTYRPIHLLGPEEQ